MFTLAEPTGEMETLNEKCKHILKELLPNISPKRTGVRLPGGASLLESIGGDGGTLYVIREGALEYHRDGKQLFFLDEGDLVGLESIFKTHEAIVQSDFTVVLDEYQAEDFFSSIRTAPMLARLWDNYLACQLALVGTLLTHVKVPEFAVKPEIRAASCGETILQEGGEGGLIYTLLDGCAEVVRGETKLYTLEEGDTFGVVATLAEGLQQGSVRAVTDSMMMVLTKDQFYDVLRSRKGFAEKLLEELSHTVTCLVSEAGTAGIRRLV